MQLNRSLDILLELDTSIGHGKFQGEIDDPEYSNAASTALYEVTLLARHYHPVVQKFAKNIASGVPATGEGCLPGEYGKWSAEELYSQFCMSDMAFNPPVPIPKKVQPKSKPKRLEFADNDMLNKLLMFPERVHICDIEIICIK
ncbi:hypothetical protein NQ317_014723 [Molorchus minor]|uniref:CCAAT-binding factor domain-containing protein n=1 Tax=Molorchus minor TaxID=1323400 RepID=A0ABQ9JK03_9CUCU|nr:hypothetical protein NQ317_014723 [Molorchus minor]